MTARTLRAVLLAAVLALTVPGAVQACVEPDLMVWPETAGPGDRVQYSITRLTTGAAYELHIRDHALASGTAASSTAPVTGSFTMPDLGDQSTGVSVEGVVEHSDIEGSPTGNDTWPVGDHMDYRVAAPAPGSQPAPSTPPTTAPTERTPAESTSPPEPKRSAGPGERARPGHASPRTRAPVQTARPTESQPLFATPTAATGEPRADSASREVLQTVPVTGGGHRPSRVHPARAAVQQLPLPGRVREETQERTVGAPDPDRSMMPLLLVAALGTAGVCAAWLMRLRGRGEDAAAPSVTAPMPRIPPDAMLEAELQEILAEERLKRFDEEHGRDMAERGEPVRAGPG